MKSQTILHLRIAVLSAGARAHNGGPHGGTVGPEPRCALLRVGPHWHGAGDGGLGQQI
jgi:hypothetical protein